MAIGSPWPWTVHGHGMKGNRFGTGTVGTGTDGIKPKTGTGSVRFDVIGTVVNLTEPAVYCPLALSCLVLVCLGTKTPKRKWYDELTRERTASLYYG